MQQASERGINAGACSPPTRTFLCRAASAECCASCMRSSSCLRLSTSAAEGADSFFLVRRRRLQVSGSQNSDTSLSESESAQLALLERWEDRPLMRDSK